MNGYKFVLASQSPRRREILGKLGIDFEVIVSDVEENTDETEPAEIVKALSKLKAEAVFERIKDDYGRLVVIGSDTVVAHNGDIMGKPKDREDAFNMIKSFAGDTHYVYSGVTVIVKDNGLSEGKSESFAESSANGGTVQADDSMMTVDESVDYSEETNRKNEKIKSITFGVGTAVEVDELSDEEIYAYINTGEPFDKAGAYAVQGLFAPYVNGIRGDYYNIVGLPLNQLYRVLKAEKIL